MRRGVMNAENQHIIFLIQHLLLTETRTKKALAEALEVPYRTLLKVYAGQGDRRSVTQVTSRVLRYCIERQIPLDKAIEQFH